MKIKIRKYLYKKDILFDTFNSIGKDHAKAFQQFHDNDNIRGDTVFLEYMNVDGGIFPVRPISFHNEISYKELMEIDFKFPEKAKDYHDFGVYTYRIYELKPCPNYEFNEIWKYE